MKEVGELTCWEQDCTCFMPKGIVKIPAPRKTFSVLTPNLRKLSMNERNGANAHTSKDHTLELSTAAQSAMVGACCRLLR
jgi:hypothetical protein